MSLTPERNYEDLLGDAIEALLAKGCDSLDDFAEGLNALQLGSLTGQRWTAALLEDELRRLGS